MTMQTREYEATPATLKNGRMITGLAVPYDTPTQLAPGFYEKIARGAVDLASRPALFYRHGEPIGVVTDLVETDQGLEITARAGTLPRSQQTAQSPPYQLAFSSVNTSTRRTKTEPPAHKQPSTYAKSR